MGNLKKYTDGGKMKLSKNLVESRAKKTKLKIVRKSTKNMRKMSEIAVFTSNKTAENAAPIVFDCEMRKIFIKGVLQDIKGYFESKTDGKVEVNYEEFSIGSHEFAFRMSIVRGLDCSKQMFSEVGSAACNVVNYMIPANEFEKFDLTTFAEDEKIEFEIVSNW